MKNKKNYIIIIIYTILLIFISSKGNLYGSRIDYLSQHSTIPDYFRIMFYETHKLIPNLALNIGAGQNIYNLSYYGLLSPIFLISYLFPFINMTTYTIISSIILYILTGLLFYNFTYNNLKYNKNISLFLSLALVTLPSISYHYHHHIMFVNYLPFLILSFKYTDNYIDNKKSTKLIISIFLLILTNYYYSLPSLIVVFIYGVYYILKKKKDHYLKYILLFISKILISILLSSILLIPTLYTIINSNREVSNIGLNILIPNFKEVLYTNYTMGITSIFLVAMLYQLFSKNKEDKFLSISIIIITILPIVMYILNGRLYIRGKVLIPFSIIYLIILGDFTLNKKNINYKKLLITNLVFIIIMIITNYKFTVFYIADTLITILLFYKSKRNNIYIYSYTIILLLCLSSFSNKDELYINKSYYNKVYDKDISNLISYINKKDSSIYRVVNDNIPKEISNKIYNNNYNTPTIYSSIYNNLYKDFYNSFGNNIRYRNNLITAGSDNIFFNNLMGVKYLIKDNSNSCQLLKSSGDYNLYYNEYAYPLIYASINNGSNNEYDKLEFPYNIEYMSLNSVVNSDNKTNYVSNIKEYKISNIKDNYKFKLDKDMNYSIKLDTILHNKVLFIEFNMNYNEKCHGKNDQVITINNIENKLSCQNWLYHNNNNKFRYVIYNKDSINSLNIYVSKGKYDIRDIKLYTMDYNIKTNYIKFNNLKIDKKNSIIKGNINTYKDTYIISSIPYDKGFKVLIDNKYIDTEIVNKAFLGFKIKKGNHNVVIKYNSPGYITGKILSIFGLIILLLNYIYERKK